jgi:hypothetical protein
VAIFSCAEAGLLEAVGLPSSVESIVVLDTMVWLEPLADMISFGNRGVVILGSSTARLFRGGPSALTEFATFDRALCNERPMLGFDSPSLGANEDRSASYVGRVAEQLLRAHRRRPFEHLVIVGCDQLRRVVDASLDQELKDVLRGIISADLARASTAEIMHVVTPIVEGAERAHERAALTMLVDAPEAAHGGLGARTGTCNVAAAPGRAAADR